jgi:hypothetical protein
MTLKRLTITLAAVLAFAVASQAALAQQAPPPKVAVCHVTGNGTFHLIVISTNALDAHLNHGDGEPGGPVPNLPGFIFGDNCGPTVAPPPEMPVGCYTLINNPPSIASLDFFYAGPIDTINNETNFFSSTNGTCSGTGFAQGDAIIAAADAATAQTKCTALTGQAGSSVSDLGAPTGSRPSEPGFWFCSPPPAG